MSRLAGFLAMWVGGTELHARAASAGLVNDALRRQAPAATTWDVGGQFRMRYEVKDNAGSFPNRDFLSGLENSNDYFLFRTKIHLGYTPASWFAAFVEGRDARSLGDSRPAEGTDSFDLHQGYVRLGDIERFPLALEIGRFELQYGDERFIGISDWSNFGRSFDAARLRYERYGLRVDGFSGRQVLGRDGHFNVVNDYDWLTGLYATHDQWIPFQTTDLFFIMRNVAAGSPTAVSQSLGGPGPRDMLTLGTRWKSLPGKMGGWDYSFEAAGQWGSVNLQDRRIDHLAYTVNAAAGYSWKDAFGAPRLGIGYDLGSGDSDPSDLHNETYELLFGTNHSPYGLMDLFGQRNLHIPRANLSLNPARQLAFSIEWLGFWMVETGDLLYPENGAGRTQNGYGRHPEYDSYVGSEIDVVLRWRPVEWGQVQVGYGHFFPGTYLRQTATGAGRTKEDADWFFLQAAINF